MFLDVKEMALGKVRFSETFLPGTLEFFDQQVRQAAPIESSGTAELLESVMEIRVSGHVKTRMEFACDRCLEPAGFAIDTDFSLLYRPASYNPAHEEIALKGEESEIGFYEDGGLELGDVLREQILLALPMQRVCREDCRGICPVCGQNRNLVNCECHEDLADDRWAGLKNL